MGREWFWVGGKNTKRVREGGREGGGGGEREISDSPSGCMNAVFQFFDFHHLICLHQPPADLNPCSNNFHPHDQPILKGLEAPRNSLESEEAASASPTKKEKEMETLNIEMGIKMKTSGRDIRARPKPSTQNNSFSVRSPSAKTPKTPTLVARLMGLDLLPDPIKSPSSSSSSNGRKKTHHPRRCRSTPNSDNNSISGTRSVPETPRSSSARRSDVDNHHRLSLQICKENNDVHFENGYSSIISPRRILKEVKENVIRRQMGRDITNTVRNREEKQRRDENLIEKKRSVDKVKESQEMKIKTQENKRSVQKCKKYNSIRVVKKTNKEQSLLMGSRCNNVSAKNKKGKKKSSLLNDLSSNISLPSSLPVMKDPSPPATKLPQKQVSSALCSKRSSQLFSCSSPRYHNNLVVPVLLSDRSNRSATVAAISGGGAELVYISGILKCIGINTNTQVSFSNWFSPCHPLGPSIFQRLEVEFACPTTSSATTISAEFGELNHRSGRRLMFDLANEILVEMLRAQRIGHYQKMKGDQLIEKLCNIIRNFPSSNCQHLEDIDAIIERDLKIERPNKMSQTSVAFKDEREAVVLGIESDIFNSLVMETTSFWCGGLFSV